MSSTDSVIRWINDITLRDVPLVGGKNASLGELHRELQAAGVRLDDFQIDPARASRAIRRTSIERRVKASRRQFRACRSRTKHLRTPRSS